MKKLIAAALLSLTFSVSAFAGTWSSPVQIGTYRIASGMDLAALAGTNSTTQVSGSCTTGQVRDYYNVYSWLCYTPQLCRGGMNVYRQTCI